MVEDLKEKLDMMSKQMGALTRERYTFKKEPSENSTNEKCNIENVKPHLMMTYWTLKQNKTHQKQNPSEFEDRQIERIEKKKEERVSVTHIKQQKKSNSMNYI